MNKKFFISWAVIFVVWMAGSFGVHGAWLSSLYAQLPNLYRTEAETQQYFNLMIIAHIIMSGAFVWIYQRGKEAKPWLPQGLRFGLAIALLGPVPMYTIYFVVQPMPGSLAIQQIIGDSVLLLILGAIVALLSTSGESS